MKKEPIDKQKCLRTLKEAFNSYAPISETSWLLMESVLQFHQVDKGELLLRIGQVAKHIHFICEGVVRSYYIDDDGSTYTKNIFQEGYFPASKVSLLLNVPSYFNIEAIEDSVIINIPFKDYRRLINERNDLKDFYIAYIEKNWIIEKEQHEISLVMENAKSRYLKFLEKHPNLEKRIAQHHIASHLGITPTQLSRIRKDLKK